jgi:hypothetical protein
MRTAVVLKALLLGSAAASLMACGPSPRQRPTGGGDDDGVDASMGPCQVSPEGELATCGDGIDNDCDGLVDCNDPNCSGVGTCPVCGTVEHPLAQPLALPDGAGAGPPYTSSLHFTGFGANQTFMDVSNIQKVCVTMEHTWLRDLQMELHAPGGQIVTLSRQEGNQCPPSPAVCEVFLGEANDSDGAENPVPGVGKEYCWSPTATNIAMLPYSDQGLTMVSFNGRDELPPGEYQAQDPWTNFNGTLLNGDWTIFVQDKWGIDNGYIFDWSISFDPALVQDCSGPVIQ